jgi:hypothetical protein
MPSSDKDFPMKLQLPTHSQSQQRNDTIEVSQISKPDRLPSTERQLSNSHPSGLSGTDQLTHSSIYQATVEDHYHYHSLNPLQMEPLTSSSHLNQGSTGSLALGHIPMFGHLSPLEQQNLMSMMQTNSPRAVQISEPHTPNNIELNVFDSNIQEYYQSRFNESQLRNSLCPPYQHNNINCTSISPFTSPSRQPADVALWNNKLPQMNSNVKSFVPSNMIPPVSNPRLMFIAPNDGVHESMKAPCMTQTMDDIAQSAVGQMPSGGSINLDELTAGSEMVCSEIQGHTNGCMFVAFSQMRPCKVKEEDLIGKNKSLKIGMAGICCKNCGGSPGCGRFFPSTFNSFVNGTNPDRVLAHVGHICIHTPSHIRNAIHELERQENVKPTCLRYGSRKSFFWYIWSKFQGISKGGELQHDELETLAHTKKDIVGSVGSKRKVIVETNKKEIESSDSHKRKTLRFDADDRKYAL